MYKVNQNAKTEFLETIGNKLVLCAEIRYTYTPSWGDEDDREEETFTINLPLYPTTDEYEKFIDALDFDYNSSHGAQEIFGCIWMQDGTWYTRGEYDGQEWWEHHECPEIPNYLKR